LWRLLKCGWLLGLSVAVLVACAAPPAARGTPVSLYMRNLSDAPVEFTMRPLGNPPIVYQVQSGGTGGGCTRAPINWVLTRTEPDKPPGQAAVLGVVARASDGVPGQARSIWVLVTPEDVTTGEGIPDWWTREAQPCTGSN
jgi:hypothetical protein